MDAQEVIISLENVTKVYKTRFIEFIALKGINLKIYKNDYVSLVGPSGSGKTTTMNIIGCMDRLTSGIYKFKDQQVEKFSARQMAHFRNKEIGFVFQSFNLMKNFDVLENILLPLEYLSGTYDEAQIHNKAEEILRELDMLDKMHNSIQALSGGQMQRVAIARALINDPEIILADEPTGNLDSKNAFAMLDIFEKIQGKGKTVIIITHEEDIAKRAKRMITMKDGLIVNEKKR